MYSGATVMKNAAIIEVRYLTLARNTS